MGSPNHNQDGRAQVTVRLRFAPGDARYAKGLIAGAKVMELFGDLETEIAIREGGDEGLCAGYDRVEFLEPLFAGDFVEGRAEVTARGNRSRTVELELFRVVGCNRDGVAEPLDPPVLAARATATIVVGTGKLVAAAAERGAGR